MPFRSGFQLIDAAELRSSRRRWRSTSRTTPGQGQKCGFRRRLDIFQMLANTDVWMLRPGAVDQARSSIDAETRDNAVMRVQICGREADLMARRSPRMITPRLHKAGQACGGQDLHAPRPTGRESGMSLCDGPEGEPRPPRRR